MPQPLVSVVIPCFNASDTIVRAIDSVRQQTYRHVEIIAVDDVSTDNTRAILREQAARGDVILVELERNLRAAGARNAGIARARGEYVAFLDADDEFLPEKLARQVKVLLTRPEVVYVTCDASNVGMDNSLRERIFSAFAPPRGPDGWRTMLAYSNAMPSVMMVRRSAVEAVGGFTLGMHLVEDQDFAIRVALIGAAEHVDEVLTMTHTQPTGISHQSFRIDIDIAWPVIRSHIRAQWHRLSWAERLYIYGCRYGRFGRNVYPEAPLLGAWFILRAILLGNEVRQNTRLLFVASPPIRALRAWLRARS